MAENGCWRTTRDLIFAMLAASGTLIGGCGSNGDRANADSAPLARLEATSANEEAMRALGYRLAWRGVPVMSAGATVESFWVLGDVCAVQDTDTGVCLMEASSGRHRWFTSLANPLTRFVGTVRDDNRLIVSSESDAYFLDLATGNLLGRQNLDRVVNTRPLQAGPVLIYGTTTGEVLGHLTLNGFRTWGNSLRSSIDADPIQIGERYAVVSKSGELLIGDLSSGSGYARAKIFDGPSAPLGASDDAVYIASSDHSLYAFSVYDGGLMWRKRTQGALNFAPVSLGGVVYCDLPGQGMTAIQATERGLTGSPVEIWSNPDVHGVVLGARADRLVVWDATSRRAATIERVTGRTVESTELSNVSIVHMDAATDGNMYCVTPNGIVHKFVPR